LTPCFPTVATHLNDDLSNLLYGFSIPLYWNILDVPSGVVPITQVNIDETSYHDGLKDDFEYYANRAMQGAAGMPLGVQLTGLPFSDEVVLRIMR
jgi:fatty acid amide hydrolase